MHLWLRSRACTQKSKQNNISSSPILAQEEVITGEMALSADPRPSEGTYALASTFHTLPFSCDSTGVSPSPSPGRLCCARRRIEARPEDSERLNAMCKSSGLRSRAPTPSTRTTLRPGSSPAHRAANSGPSHATSRSSVGPSLVHPKSQALCYRHRSPSACSVWTS